MGNGSVKQPKRKPELLNCPICFNLYKTPRMLPCQHTFCEGCLHSYITKAVAQDPEALEFPCPVCREKTTPPEADKSREKWAKLFPKNRLILSLFEAEPERSEYCRLHPNKLIDFFCESHVEIGCSTCLLTRHKTCELVPLEEYIRGSKFRRSCSKNNDMLLQYKKIFEDMVSDIGKNVDELDKDRSNMIEHIKETRAEIEKRLNELEEKLVSAINEVFETESECLSNQIGRCRKVINDIDNTIQQMAATQSDIKTVQKAEIIVAVEEKLSNFGNNMKEEHGSFSKVTLTLTLDPLIHQLTSSLTELGRVKTERSGFNKNLPEFVPKSIIQEPPDVKRHRNKHVARVSEHSVSGMGEAFYCNITSTVVLPDGRVILADDSNCKLKLLSNRLQLTNIELKLSANPLNLASISDTEVAVSLPGKREVVIVGVGLEEFLTKRSIKTRLDCWGLEVVQDTVVVTTGRDGHSVIMLDMEGKELFSFLLTTHADENIRCPVAVIADKRKNILYITCTGGAWSKGCVISTDMSGKLLNVYSDPDIDTPRSCAMDRHGKFYICGLESSSVYQMTESGEVFRIFPAKNLEVVGPLHINFIKNYHIRFILTEVASDILKVFELPTAK